MRHRAIDALVELSRRCLPVRAVWLFGSRARQDHTPESDIDIAIRLERACPEQWARFVAEAVETAPTLLNIDLVDIDSCDADLRKSILREGVMLYGS
ncbi:MAG: nucleotidyltransferase domain-containing protein [Deltaproteobacteria bacterium]|nr:MAG: nucleotidyltransferase domain-containing protein [Deltaproteobacteria bacterium]